MNIYEFRERGSSGVDEETERLASESIGAAIEVHRVVKPGMPESVYRKALSHELTLRRIPHECEVTVPVFYKGQLVGEGRIEILVAGQLILELKSVESLTEVHRAQVIAYLQAKRLKLGLLSNFNVALLRNGIKRVINTFENLRE